MMEIVLTPGALIPIFMAFFMTFRTLPHMSVLLITIMSTPGTFIPIIVTFIITFRAVMMALFTIAIGFKVVHFFTSL